MSTPALTAEERAQAIVERYDAISEERIDMPHSLVLFIASAIREAEVAAYERAAAATLGQIPLWLQAKAGAQAKDYWEGYRDAIDDALEDIRSLKSQKETP